MTDGAPASTAEELKAAMAQGRFRPRWDCPNDPVAPHLDALLAAAWELVRRRHPVRPGTSQDETLVFEKAERLPDGGARVEGRYWFDHDFCSQYDKTEGWRFGFDWSPTHGASHERWEP